jgi:chemotaxis protein MotA
MFIIIGIVVVFGSIISGYLMEHGNLKVLLQPAELIIIGGAAIGTLLIANPAQVIKKIIGGVMGCLKGSHINKAYYLDTLKMCYELLNKARKDGLLAIESDIEEPTKSAVFTKYPKFLKDDHARDFVCDTMRMAVTGGIDPFDLDQMMDLDMEVSHREESAPISALSTVADALPGLGIVAAVLGVVITMGALGGPPEEIGRKVASALVGTFLGVLLCYGLVGPVSANMAKRADAEHAYVYVIRVVLISFIKGAAPIQALEFGRRAIPGHLRPGFIEMEKTCKQNGNAAAEPVAAEEGA